MAYRFATDGHTVEFALGPLSGYTFGPFTAAVLLKRNVVGGIYGGGIFLINSGFGAPKFETYFFSNDVYRVSPGHVSSALSYNSTALWYLLVVTGTGVAPPRFHIHDGTSWLHGPGGSNFLGSSVVATDRLFTSPPAAWGGEYVKADVVCAGIKKSDSTDLQVETLSRTLFNNWANFGFDWLVGFESSAALVNRAAPGSGDEIARIGTSLVADPPGWEWTPRPVSSGTGVLPNIVVSKPTATVDGDLLLAVLSFYMADNSKDVTSVPPGWTLLRTLNNFTQSNHRTSVYWKIASSEPSTWTFGTNATIAHGQCWAAIAIPSPVSPYISDSSSQIDPDIGPNNHTAPSVNASSAADMLVYIGGGRTNVITAWNPPSGYTEQVDIYEAANGDNSIEIATKAAAGAAGATGPVTATTSGGGDMESILIALTRVATPVANFTASPLSGIAPLSIAFTDTSTNFPTSWAWTFGDGATSTAQNPSHSYTTPGTYTVTLTATNAAGSNIKTQTGLVTVAPPVPVANFSGSPLSGPMPLSVTFTDLSTNMG